MWLKLYACGSQHASLVNMNTVRRVNSVTRREGVKADSRSELVFVTGEVVEFVETREEIEQMLGKTLKLNSADADKAFRDRYRGAAAAAGAPFKD